MKVEIVYWNSKGTARLKKIPKGLSNDGIILNDGSEDGLEKICERIILRGNTIEQIERIALKEYYNLKDYRCTIDLYFEHLDVCEEAIRAIHLLIEDYIIVYVAYRRDSIKDKATIISYIPYLVYDASESETLAEARKYLMRDGDMEMDSKIIDAIIKESNLVTF